ncbi:MAG: cache domain-containing protein [Anaerolineales bacterium]|nr:cache domain-containing protein [Anaerolineales bacterium]
MKTIIGYFRDLYSGPFQATLVFSFALVAALTIGINAWVVSSVINNYLVEVMDERVARDIHLAETFYEIRLQEVAGIAEQLSLSCTFINNIEAVRQGNINASILIEDKIINFAESPLLSGSLYVAILDINGNVLTGQIISTSGEQTSIVPGGNWSSLPFFQEFIHSQSQIAAVEVIPGTLLQSVGMAEQAHIELIDTPKAAPQLFDPREGNAGLALAGIAPIMDGSQLLGSVLAFHMFNNDYALVDQIRDAAQIDTVTIFFGDLRVSTNVMTAEGQRAVGTRVSQEVSDVVLHGGKDYIGTAFVVNENYITRYEPLRDHAGQIVGIMNVGVRQSVFHALIQAVNQRILLVAGLTILMTFFLATPVSRMITRPLKELRELSSASHQVADGDLSARAPVMAGGEVGQLAAAFNNMLDTLQITQDQLVHKENLASLGQLAAGVAHELNNPLATVLLYADILKRECPEDDPRSEGMETIVRETNRCKTIVAALLDFARQHQVEAQVLDLNALIQTIIEIEGKHALYEDISIQTDLAPDLPEIQADPVQLQAVFINLLSNAAEAVPGGGTITIRTKPGPTGMVTIKIEDTGEGIALENLPKVYTPFFTTKPIGKGTGLGLAITYGIIKMHRGQINVQSQVGEGTTFTIHLRLRLPNRGEVAQFPNHTPPDQDLIGG